MKDGKLDPVFLKLVFRHQKVRFKAYFEGFFLNIWSYFNILAWPDPLHPQRWIFSCPAVVGL